MSQRATLYLFASAIAPVLAIACVFSFAAEEFRLVWECALAVVLCMEARVQLGERLPHAALFWTHLFSAIPFFLALTALAFFAQPAWLSIAAALLGLVALGSGSILWYRGVTGVFAARNFA